MTWEGRTIDLSFKVASLQQICLEGLTYSPHKMVYRIEMHIKLSIEKLKNKWQGKFSTFVWTNSKFTNKIMLVLHKLLKDLKSPCVIVLNVIRKLRYKKKNFKNLWPEKGIFAGTPCG